MCKVESTIAELGTLAVMARRYSDLQVVDCVRETRARVAETARCRGGFLNRSGRHPFVITTHRGTEAPRLEVVSGSES